MTDVYKDVNKQGVTNMNEYECVTRRGRCVRCVIQIDRGGGGEGEGRGINVTGDVIEHYFSHKDNSMIRLEARR